MPRSAKKKKFSATKAVKANARAVIGTPPATRLAANLRKGAKQKHKETLAELLKET